MNFSIRHRIEKLEAIDMRLAKRIVWEDGSGSAEREIARLDAVGNIPLYTAIGLVAISLAARAEDLSTATAFAVTNDFVCDKFADHFVFVGRVGDCNRLESRCLCVLNREMPESTKRSRAVRRERPQHVRFSTCSI
jgi:hypothetical protein